MGEPKLGSTLQMADLLLCCCFILESTRGRDFRIPDQPADHTLHMQGLNLTALHAHMALFGVYGMLGIGLLLFCLRGLNGTQPWKTKLLSFSFWALNIGLLAMGFLSLLPVGVLQTLASMGHGMWYARSAEFLQQGYMQKLVWMRVLGDTIFAIGIVGLVWFIVGLKTGKSYAADLKPGSIHKVE